MRFRMKREWENQLDTELGTGTLKIEYEFDPGEARVNHYPDGSGNPGTPPSVTIIKMEYNLEEPDIDFVSNLELVILDGELTDENPND